jgi:hypothetical protein
MTTAPSTSRYSRIDAQSLVRIVRPLLRAMVGYLPLHLPWRSKKSDQCSEHWSTHLLQRHHSRVTVDQCSEHWSTLLQQRHHSHVKSDQCYERWATHLPQRRNLRVNADQCSEHWSTLLQQRHHSSVNADQCSAHWLAFFLSNITRTKSLTSVQSRGRLICLGSIRLHHSSVNV